MNRAFLATLALIYAPFTQAQTVTPTEAWAIAKEAVIYGFPLVDNYRIQHSYFVDRSNPEFKAAWNAIFNNAQVYTPDDKAIQTPNSDTPYSYIGTDLRAEPLVFTVPAVEKGRYYSLQFIDMYTFNFAYVGSRATGNGAGSYLLAGPKWNGKKPKGIKSVIRSETEFAFVLYRTQLFNPGDIENVKKIQAGYKVKTLSAFLRKPAPAAPPAVDFLKPLTAEQQRTSLQFFNELNFIIQFCPTYPFEKALMACFAKIGVGAGKRFMSMQVINQDHYVPQVIYGKGSHTLTRAKVGTHYVVTAIRTFVDPADPEDIKKVHALQDAIKVSQKSPGTFEAHNLDAASQKKVRDALLVLGSTMTDFKKAFGTKVQVDPVRHLIGTALGWGGNPDRDATYLNITAPKNDGSTVYKLNVKDVPVDAFWSVSVYDAKGYYEKNPYDAYTLNNVTAKKGGDGSIAIQFGGCDGKIVNCLPIVSGWNYTVRLYRPRAEILNGKWKLPEPQLLN